VTDDLLAVIASFSERLNGMRSRQQQELLRCVLAIIALPECLQERLRSGDLRAPTLREERRADGERFVVLDFTVEVEPEALPAWESIGRVLGADWGVHSLLTTTAISATASDEPGSQVGGPFFLNTGGFDGRQSSLPRAVFLRWYG
jgi:hypothetical protein